MGRSFWGACIVVALCVSPAARAADAPANPAREPGAPRCFENDPAAGLTSREPHLDWAKDKSGAQLTENLDYKVDLLARCLNPDELALGFGTASVAIAKRVHDAACFGGDTGVLNPSVGAHRDWALQRTPEQYIANLKWKMAAAMQCLDPAQQKELFADLSFALALAPLEKP
jgi:hypothetical protein